MHPPPHPASAVLLTALVAGGFLLFLASFMGVGMNPNRAASSAASSASNERAPASLAATSSSSSSEDRQPPPPKEKKKEQAKAKAAAVGGEVASPSSPFADAAQAFLARARKENAEKPVHLAATAPPKNDAAAASSSSSLLPRVAVLFYPTEHGAALALTKALEAALLEEGEQEPLAVEEVLGGEGKAAGEEDGWLIRVEG